MLYGVDIVTKPPKLPLFSLKTEFPFRATNEDNESANVKFKTWEDFCKSIWSKSLYESELNVVVRFQWNEEDILQLAVIQLQEGRLLFFHIKVTKKDEPDVRYWLQQQYKILVSQWRPISK